jgi:hypothetical protein
MKIIRALALVSVLTASLLDVATAFAQEAHESKSLGLDAFWRSRKYVDSEHYRRVTWYAGAYAFHEDSVVHFSSELYRDVELCEERPVRDKCSLEHRLLGNDSSLRTGDRLHVDRMLTTGALRATYRMKKRIGGRWVQTNRRIGLNATVSGAGSMYRSRATEKEWDGDCLLFSYELRYRWRESTAIATLSGDVSIDLRRTSDTRLWRRRERTVENTCAARV